MDVRVQALVDLPYDGVDRRAGSTFEASAHDADLLARIGSVKILGTILTKDEVPDLRGVYSDVEEDADPADVLVKRPRGRPRKIPLSDPAE